MKMADFFTSDIASQGKKTEIPGPDGTPSGHHLIIRHTDSSEYRQALLNLKRSAAGGETVDKREGVLSLLVSLVAGWDLEDEFTPENVRKLLTQAPYIEELVDTVSVRRSVFFTGAPKS